MADVRHKRKTSLTGFSKDTPTIMSRRQVAYCVGNLDGCIPSGRSSLCDLLPGNQVARGNLRPITKEALKTDGVGMLVPLILRYSG